MASDAYQFCTLNEAGHILTVTINRPEAMNALHPPAQAELQRAFDYFEENEQLLVTIITGKGNRAFCAGLDLRHQSEEGTKPFPPSGFGGLTERFSLRKPVIAAVNGIAMGGGFELALACDLIIASQSAAFALPEPRVGVAALAGGLHRLPRQIGLKPAMGMILTGRQVSADEGYRMGFVNQVAPPSGLMAAAQNWADQILSCSPVAIRASKEVVYRGLDHARLEDAMDHRRYPGVADLMNSDDFIEGPRAFREKRAPKWTIS